MLCGGIYWCRQRLDSDKAGWHRIGKNVHPARWCSVPEEPDRWWLLSEFAYAWFYFFNPQNYNFFSLTPLFCFLFFFRIYFFCNFASCFYVRWCVKTQFVFNNVLWDQNLGCLFWFFCLRFSKLLIYRHKIYKKKFQSSGLKILRTKLTRIWAWNFWILRMRFRISDSAICPFFFKK